MILTYKTAKRIEELKFLSKQYGIKSRCDVEIEAIIEFKNELKEIKNSKYDIDRLIREIESVEKQ